MAFLAACVPADSNQNPPPGAQEPRRGSMTHLERFEDPTRGVTCYSARTTWQAFSCVKTAPETAYVRVLSGRNSELAPTQ